MAPQTEIQRYVRFEITGRVAYGWWRDGAIEELKGSIYGAATPTGRTFRSEQVRLLVPCEPSKVVAVGLNYASHQQFVTSAEGGFTTPGGKPAAEFRLLDIDGRQISSADLKGVVVVLGFWATWCDPCLAEIPTFNRLREKYAGRGVKVVGIALQSGCAEDIKPYQDQYKITYPILIGEDKAIEKYGVTGFPTTYILDKDFKVHRKFTGRLPERDQLEREIESLLAGR